MQPQLEIVEAIEQELHYASQPQHFKVCGVTTGSNSIRIGVRPQPGTKPINSGLEGGVAKWKCFAFPVISVSADDDGDHIYVQRGRGPVPITGTDLTVQPPRFLDSLLNCWKNDKLAAESFSWAAHALVGHDRSTLVICPSFSDLRERQRHAYSLVSFRAGFLWGPPGTGKTTTAGSIVADLVRAYTNLRVLLLGPTNSSVDQLLIAVDNRLARSTAGQTLRSHCARIGSNFLAHLYQNRKHLLPEATDELILRKAQLEALQPSTDDVEARARWQQEMDRLSSALRCHLESVLGTKRVVAMTATLATMHFSMLLQDGNPFDLIVFDEASQLGRAISMMLAILGRNALIAGDPYQLAPIIASKHSSVRQWFGRTLFDDYMHAAHPSTCFLNEQSRMATPICGLISEMFYDGNLNVSHSCLRDPKWLDYRQPLRLYPGEQAHNLHVVKIRTNSVHEGGSYARLESAETAVMLAQQVTRSVDPAQVLILTPFRAQRKLIWKLLKARGMRLVKVNTVHAAQGSERLVIIFDPVNGTSQFLMNLDNRKRLLNVAISRAQACFVLLASAGDLKHPVLCGIANHIENGRRAGGPS